MITIAPTVFFEAGMQTGEGPLWDPRSQTLWCVDSTNPSIWRFSEETGAVDRMALPERIGFVALTEIPGRLVAGLETGLYHVDFAARGLEFLIDPEPDKPGNRINDGIVDVDGGIIFGTLDDALNAPTGRAYKLYPDGRLVCFDEGYIVFNGPFPHPDGQHVFAVNSEVREIYVFRRSTDGTFRDRRLFTHWPADWRHSRWSDLRRWGPRVDCALGWPSHDAVHTGW